MADSTFTIGATVNVGQLAAGMNEAGKITEQALDKMLVDFSMASSSTARAVAKISDDTRAAALSVGSSWQRVAQAQLEAAASAKEVSGATLLASKRGEDAALSANLLAAAQQKAARNAAELAEAQAAVGIATKGASEANIATRLTTDMLTGNFARADQALIRFASHTSLIGPAIEAAFVPFAIATFAEILFRAGEKAYHLYENVFLLKSSIEALQKADAAAAEKTASLHYEVEEAIARRLEAQGKLTEATAEFAKAAADKPLDLLKIDDKNFNQFNDKFVTFLQGVHTSAEAPTVIARIEAEAEATKKKLEETKAARDELLNTPATDYGEAAAYGGTAEDLKEKEKLIADYTEKISLLHEAVSHVQLQTELATEAAATKVAEAIKKVDAALNRENEEIAKTHRTHDELADSATRVVDAYNQLFETEIKIQNEETEMFAQSAQKDIAKSIEAAQKKADAAVKYSEEYNKISEQSALKEIAEQESAVAANARLQQAKLAGAMTMDSSRIRMSAEINAQELAGIERLENEKLALQLKGLENQKALLLGGQTEDHFQVSNIDNYDQLGKLLQVNSQIEAAKQAHVAKMAQLNAQEAVDAQDTANKETQSFLKAFQAIDQALPNAINSWLDGTMTFQRAMMRMWDELAMSAIRSLEKTLLAQIQHSLAALILHTGTEQAKTAATATGTATRSGMEDLALIKHIARATAEIAIHVAKEIAKTAATIAGFIAREAVEIAAHLADAARKASEAAMGAFAAATSIPIIGLALAPIAAAGAFAGVMAFASAEGGMVSGAEQLAFIHRNEMVLPAQLSQGFQHIIGNMSGGAAPAAEAAGSGRGSSGTSHHYGDLHVNAFDARGVADMIRSNRGEFTRAAAGIMRDGWRPKR